MTSTAFDTLKLARNLRDKAKFNPEQAEGLADAMAEALQGDIATKADVLTVKTELRATELRLKADIEAVCADIIKWMFGTSGFQTLVIIGTLIALVRIAPK
jgi:hypothetical protein